MGCSLYILQVQLIELGRKFVVIHKLQSGLARRPDLSIVWRRGKSSVGFRSARIDVNVRGFWVEEIDKVKRRRFITRHDAVEVSSL